MKVFIGWSGETGRQVAGILERWIHSLFSDIEFSAAFNVMPGSSWTFALQDMLKTSDIGLICVTRESIQSPWLYYEAGMLSASNHAVIPFLFDIALSEFNTPLRHYECVSANRDGLMKLALGLEDKISDSQDKEADINRFMRLFDALYPAVAAEFDELRKSQQKADGQSDYSADKLGKEISVLNHKLDEILSTLAVSAPLKREPS